MSLPPKLFSLQQVDSDLDKLNARLGEIRASRQETSELVEAREDVDQRRESLRQIEARVKDLEWTVSDLTSEIKRHEAKLYGGTIQNPKELDGFSREVEQDQRRRGQTEDELLECMGAQEDEEGSQEQAVLRLDSLLREWNSQQERLTKEESEIDERLGHLVPERDLLLDEIPAQPRLAYEKLRSTRRGLAVATINRNNCGGCRIALPVVVLQKVRRNDDDIHCPSCGRFLVTGA